MWGLGMKTVKFTVRLPEYLMTALREKAQKDQQSVNTTILTMMAKWMARKK